MSNSGLGLGRLADLLTCRHRIADTESGIHDVVIGVPITGGIGRGDSDFLVGVVCIIFNHHNRPVPHCINSGPLRQVEDVVREPRPFGTGPSIEQEAIELGGIILESTHEAR